MRPNAKVTRIAVALSVASLVAGCGGGSGGGDPPPQLLQPSLRGKTYEAMSANYRVPSDSFDYSSVRDASANTTINTSSDGRSLQFSVSETTDAGGAVSFNQTVTLPPEASEYSAGLHYPGANRSLSHMAFGEWNERTSTLATGGFFAFGNTTPGPAIPTASTATYAGRFTGMLWSSFGGSRIDGALDASADFGTRTVWIQGTPSSGSSLHAFSGNLSYAPGENALSGTFFSNNFHWGPAYARFFGPGAEELGGVFRMTRPVCLFSCVGNEVYMGSFGASRQ